MTLPSKLAPADACQRHHRRLRQHARAWRRFQFAGLALALPLVSLRLSGPAFARSKPGYKPYATPGPRGPAFEHPPREVKTPYQLEREQQYAEMEAELRGCAEDGEVPRAMSLLEEFKEDRFYLGPRHFLQALQACEVAGSYEDAGQLLKDMEKARKGPDHEAYHAAIASCAGQGEDAARYSLQLFDEMQQRGLMPNLVTYNRIITALVKNGFHDDAKDKFQDATRLGYMECFTNRARFLDVQDLTIEVAELVVRLAVEDRAKMMVKRKAGKGGFYVLTGPANKRTALKQQAILRVLREEYGLKVRVDPAKFGRVIIRGTELQELGIEMMEEQER